MSIANVVNRLNVCLLYLTLNNKWCLIPAVINLAEHDSVGKAVTSRDA